MNGVLALCVLLATVAVVLAGDTYTTKYDNINVDEILGNERLRKVYSDCLMAEDDKSCPEEGKELRRDLPDALATVNVPTNRRRRQRRSSNGLLITTLRDGKN
ncbi:ejaculatory bulb-specific protein 3-like [Anabrus simplex]|uniref:ejaculatory bulb-specific protein 3-like n=1 Tax=Anabrus simplex TaxID=316456 RepID=UPI0035A2AA98